MSQRPPIPDAMLVKWRRIVTILAEIVGAPSALVMKTEPPDHFVCVANDHPDSPYRVGDNFTLNTGLYCDHVLRERSELLVRDATREPDWSANPDLDVGMSFYLGLPLSWPDGGLFGTICVLDREVNETAVRYRTLLAEFMKVIDTDLAMLVDMAERARLEAELLKSHDELERRVRARTSELEIANRALRGREAELQDVNTALRILLERVETGRAELEESVSKTIAELVTPHLEKLKRMALPEHAASLVTMADANLRDITSGFSGELAAKLAQLTPTEVEVAQLVMLGRSTKEIADALARETSTIDFHRNNIRKKLGLRSQGVTLRSYLTSLR